MYLKEHTWPNIKSKYYNNNNVSNINFFSILVLFMGDAPEHSLFFMHMGNI